MAAKAEEVAREKEAYDLARAKWEASGITPEQAKALRLTPLSPGQTADLGDTFLRTDSLLIPYFDLKGKETGFFRVRYLGPLPGFAGQTEKPQRYAQPPKTLNEVYLPTILSRPWEEIAKDVSVTIHITEGELKAAAGCGVGLAVLGLGGVDVWKSAKRQVAFLPMLEKIEWSNRQVVICFDSDAAAKPGVVRAQRDIAREVLARGGIVRIATLPPTKDGEKQGLDDLLVAEGPEALNEILADAPPFQESDALWALNDEVFYVRDPGIVVDRETGQRYQPARFVADAYANRHYLETVFDKDGNPKFRKKPLAKRWIEWESRFELGAMTYAPGKEKIFDNTFNTWPGWRCEPKKGDVSPWKWLLGFLFKNDPTYQDWFEQWCAYPLQHPGSKLFTSAVLWGTQKGTGKSFIPYMLMGIYGQNSIEVKSKNLKSGFNAWAKNRQFVYADEISGSDARIDADWLKGLITQQYVTINEKYLPEYTVPDCMNYLFSSNHPDALFLEDNDRRFFVHEVVGAPAEETMYQRAHHWLHGTGGFGSYAGRGAAALFAYLLSVDLRSFNPFAPAPVTRAKEAMILASKSDVGNWVHQLREDPDSALRPLQGKAAREAAVFDVNTLLRAYDPEGKTRVTASGLARALVSGGFRQVNETRPVRTKHKLVRLYAIRETLEWLAAKPQAIAKHYDRYFGPDAGR